MKILIFLIVCFISFGSVIYGQGGLFEKYRFEDGGYSFVGVFVHHSDHSLQKKLGEFYTDDISVLNSLKKSWIFPREQRMHACGYHYELLILKDGQVVDSFAVNLECNEIVTDVGSLYFDHKKLRNFASSFKPLYSRRDKFDTVSEARQYLLSTRKDANFVHAEKPRWLEFEGEFSFNLKCPAELKNCYATDEFRKIEPQLRAEISRAYPGEKFELAARGGSSNGDLYVRVKCDKSLEEKFSIFDRWNREAFGKWEANDLSLTSYWKVPHDRTLVQ